MYYQTYHFVSFILLCGLQLAASQGIECLSGNTTDPFCIMCTRFGGESRIDSYFSNGTCHMAFDVMDNNTMQNVGPRCEEAWQNMTFPASCQLSIFPNLTEAQVYYDRGLRNANRRMFIGLYRDNCNSTWYWKARDGTTTLASSRNQTDCQRTVGAFEGTLINEVDPSNYPTNAFTCQCIAKNGTAVLPGSKGVSGGLASFGLIVMMVMVFVGYS